MPKLLAKIITEITEKKLVGQFKDILFVVAPCNVISDLLALYVMTEI